VIEGQGRALLDHWIQLSGWLPFLGDVLNTMK
jgi:hypothetical protein